MVMMLVVVLVLVMPVMELDGVCWNVNEYVNEAQDLYCVAGPEVPSQIYIKTTH